MSNSSPTVRERIKTAAMGDAYSNARLIGCSAVTALGEAEMVGDFIDELANHNKGTSRSRSGRDAV
jgi:hypothetical protein